MRAVGRRVFDGDFGAAALNGFCWRILGVLNPARRGGPPLPEGGAVLPLVGLPGSASSVRAAGELAALCAPRTRPPTSPHGIRVNIVSPGSTDTAMQQAMWALGSSREAVIAGDPARWRLGIPLAKIATPDEIARAVLFLLSDQASHITLHDLRVDGGATLDQ